MALVPGTRSVHQGHHPHDEIRVPAPARCGRQRNGGATALRVKGFDKGRGPVGLPPAGQACHLPLQPGEGPREGSLVKSRSGRPARCGYSPPDVAAPLKECGGQQGVSGGEAAAFWSWRARGRQQASRHRVSAQATVRARGIAGRGLSHPSGVTPHHGRSRRAPPKTGACGQLGSRTADRMAVPLSPSIRERACPARLRPARTLLISRRTQ